MASTTDVAGARKATLSRTSPTTITKTTYAFIANISFVWKISKTLLGDIKKTENLFLSCYEPLFLLVAGIDTVAAPCWFVARTSPVLAPRGRTYVLLLVLGCNSSRRENIHGMLLGNVNTLCSRNKRVLARSRIGPWPLCALSRS